MSSETRIFLESVFANKPDELYLQLGITPDQEPVWCATTEEAILRAEQMGEYGVFAGMRLATRDHGATVQCRPEEFVGVVGFSAIIHLRSDAYTQPTLPRTVEHAVSILPKDMPPSFVVFAGNAVQAVWLLQEPYIFENDDDRETAATLASRWHTLLRDHARLRGGWTIGQPGDLTGFLSVPGSATCEDPANPKLVTIHSLDDRRYSSAELMEHLDDMGVAYQPASAEATRDWAQCSQHKELIINLTACVPNDLLNQWMEADSEFKNTWFRQRSDLRDQSQSEYDLAVARFGATHGLEEQQIIDLIVQHRATHRQKPRSRLDYFQRILSKATNADDWHVRSGADGPAPGDTGPTADSHRGGSPNPDDVAPSRENPERMKIALCDQISEALGVQVLRIVKLSGNDPVYRIEFAEGKVHFESIRKLISQHAVQGAIAGCTGTLIPSFKQAAWRRLVQSMLDACVVEEGGEELECEGAIRMHLARYLSESDFIGVVEGQRPQDLRKPMVRQGRITVCASDLQIFINKTTMQNLPVRTIATMLSAAGARMIRIRGSKIREQSRWELPLEDFDLSDYRDR